MQHSAYCTNMHSTIRNEERAIAAAIRREAKEFTALSYECLTNETSTDPNIYRLMDLIEAGFPADCCSINGWRHRKSLYISMVS